MARRKVTGFAWKPTADAVRSTHLDDKLLLDGEEELAYPPDRPVPQTAENAEPIAPMPPDDLPHHLVRHADSISPRLALRAEALLDLPGAPWQPLARMLFSAVHAAGHRLWLSGGAARDVVAGAPLRDINDLDLAGTMPTGRFCDVAFQSLRASQMSEFRPTVYPGLLVCSVLMPRTDEAFVFEYRGLNLGGFRFPAVGSRLAEDARHRDFSFNALLYDVFEHEVYDPSGRGLDDLLGEERCFHPLKRPAEVGEAAETVLRGTKFALRWKDSIKLDLAPFYAWIEQLPRDLCASLTEVQWHGLATTYKKEVSAPINRQLDFAAETPQPGRELIETLIGRSR